MQSEIRSQCWMRGIRQQPNRFARSGTFYSQQARLAFWVRERGLCWSFEVRLSPGFAPIWTGIEEADARLSKGIVANRSEKTTSCRFRDLHFPSAVRGDS